MGDARIACSLDQGDLTERGERWRALAERAELEVAPTAGGLRLLFRDAPGVDGELRQLVALERECCGFADWSLRKAIVLEVSGTSPDAIAAVQGLFGPLRSDRTFAGEPELR
jgi:hypothetical protein